MQVHTILQRVAQHICCFLVQIMTILNDHDNSAKVFSNVESSFSRMTEDGLLVTQVSWQVQGGVRCSTAYFKTSPSPYISHASKGPYLQPVERGSHDARPHIIAGCLTFISPDFSCVHAVTTEIASISAPGNNVHLVIRDA